jgi:hypothetical protein
MNEKQAESGTLSANQLIIESANWNAANLRKQRHFLKRLFL